MAPRNRRRHTSGGPSPRKRPWLCRSLWERPLFPLWWELLARLIRWVFLFTLLSYCRGHDGTTMSVFPVRGVCALLLPSVFTAGLSLEPRGSSAVSTTTAARIPSFARLMLSLMVRTSCDERGWSRQVGVGAG